MPQLYSPQKSLLCLFMLLAIAAGLSTQAFSQETSSGYTYEETSVAPSENATTVMDDATLDVDPLIEAKQLIASGKSRQAKAILEALLTQNQVKGPRAIETRMALGAIARDNGQPAEARRHLELALRLNPNNPKVLAELGYLFTLASVDDYHPNHTMSAKADEFFTNAERLNAKDSWVLLRRADQARLNLETSHQPIDIATWQRLDTQYQAAENAGAPPEDSAPGRLAVWIALAPLQHQRFDDAIGPILYELDKAPTHAGYRLLLARWYAAQQQTTPALQQALLAVEASETVQPATLTLVAQLYERLGDTANARQFYERVLQEAPNHTPTLIALGDLLVAQNQSEEGLAYLRQAMTNEPQRLEQRLTAAQEAIRDEHTTEGLRRLTPILQLTEGVIANPELFDPIRKRALHAAANAISLDAFYGKPPVNTPPVVAQALQTAVNDSDPLIKLDGLKFLNARAGRSSLTWSTELKGPLEQILLVSSSLASDALASGEALFLLQQYPQANRALDGVEGNTAQEYLENGDRLLGIQAMTAATAQYQRGLTLSPLAALSQGLKKVQEKRRLAEQRIVQGNGAYDGKQFTAALEQYMDAKKLYPDWDLPWIRLGDTHFALKQYQPALDAYEQAVRINPSYLAGPAFKKRLDSLRKKAAKNRK
ncbi:MAG: tetratricopeptide repeat protein [Vampirovibrionales bacterium]|nr:tetratricopeptide repeat protein [Vampirovibrionales bacterium]